VIAASVLALVQAGLVLLASLYVGILGAAVSAISARDASLSPGEAHALGTEALVVAIVQVVSAVALIVGGVMALNSRRRPALLVLLAALAGQVLLSVYWAVRITSVLNDLSGGGSIGPFLAFTLVFAAGPLVGMGLLLLGPGRAWFSEPRTAAAR
jgi:hypothetical protein